MPASACSRRRVPSKPNGFVTMPTVSAPSSRAMRAMTGAAPVPVPPPAPAVMKIMSEPLSMALMRSYSSIAEARPSSGFEPEPRPRVSCAPMCSVSWAIDCCSDCRSVLTAMNSTPLTSASTMRLTALEPPPPTPTTRSTGWPAGFAWPNGVSRPVSGRANASRLSRARRVGRADARGFRRGLRHVHEVVGQVELRGERVAQALLRRRDADFLLDDDRLVADGERRVRHLARRDLLDRRRLGCGGLRKRGFAAAAAA